MTLQEALLSGKKFTRSVYMDDGFNEAEQFLSSLNKEDVLATDYVLEPDDFTITEEDLVEAWEAARVGLNSVKSASESQLFKRMLSHLKGN